jgi:hypothetical protein
MVGAKIKEICARNRVRTRRWTTACRQTRRPVPARMEQRAKSAVTSAEKRSGIERRACSPSLVQQVAVPVANSRRTAAILRGAYARSPRGMDHFTVPPRLHPVAAGSHPVVDAQHPAVRLAPRVDTELPGSRPRSGDAPARHRTRAHRTPRSRARRCGWTSKCKRGSANEARPAPSSARIAPASRARDAGTDPGATSRGLRRCRAHSALVSVRGDWVDETARVALRHRARRSLLDNWCMEEETVESLRAVLV